KQGQSGLAFRYHNSRCYYFFGFNESGLVLKMVQHEAAFHEPYEEILGEYPCDWLPGQIYTALVSVQGSRIRAEMEGLGILEATAERYPRGQIALVPDAPTAFRHVKVTADNKERRRVSQLKSKQERELEDLQAANPKPVLWKKMSTRGFG